jgi:hypothetical protein
VKNWKARIVLSVCVVIQSAVLAALLAIYVLAPARGPFPLMFLGTMTALLVCIAVLVSVSR